MNRSIRKEFHSSLASLLLNEIQYQKSNYYYFLGKTDPWAVLDVSSDSNVQTSESEDIKIRNNSIYFKRIGQNDVTLACVRYDWTMNEVVPTWDHSIPMDTVGFYRFTDEFNVYVCLDNKGGSQSTVKPTGTSFYPVRTSDGYLWKFMYSVPAFKRRRFASSMYIPVQRALTDSFYNKGSIEDAIIVSGGSGYSDALLTYITVSGTTTGSGAVASIAVNSSGAITSVTVSNGGTGYTKGVTLSVTTSTGVGAVLTPTIVSGVITSIAVTTAGVGYTNANPVAFSVGGAIFVPVVSRTTGSIVDVKTINPGIGYTAAPTLTVNTPSTGTGAYTGHSTALLEAIVDNGTVQRVLIRDPGINYPSSSATTISIQGDGTGAVISPVIYNGSIIDIVVESAGSSYTSANLNVIGSGTGAVLKSVVGNSDYTSQQSIVEQTAVVGAIYSVKVTAGGLGYTGTTIATISGDGTGATASVTVNASGRVTAITMTSFGTGYTYATVSISDSNRVDPVGTIPLASGYAILPPISGHGADAVTELNGNIFAISSSLRTDTNLNSLTQDYRQFGLIKNPRTLQTGKLFKADNDVNIFSSVFSSVSGLVIDELLAGTNTSFRVISISGLNVTLQPMSQLSVSPIGTLTAVANPSRTYVCNSVSTIPTVNKYSGDLLYVSNENPFSFTENQGILIKTYLKF